MTTLTKIANYIDGELIPPNSGKYLDNFEPATGKIYSKIPDSDKSDVDRAVMAAKMAFPQWSTTPKEKRAKIMMRIANLIDENLEEFALAESKDNGKPVKLARKVDIPRASSNMRFFATAIQHFASESHSMEDQAINYTVRSPLGVVVCISPWNLPLYLFTWKIAPALAAGNCVVAKPSEITPFTAYKLSELCIQAGLPKGVLNIVHGLGQSAGSAMVAHPDVKAISFTGGTATGRAIALQAAADFKKTSLEMGGKNPNLIFADCDFDEMLRTTLLSSFSNQGEICLCGSRILIEEPLYEKFKNEFVTRTKKLKVGIPYEDVHLGAIVSKAHYEKILSYISLAKEEGGKILCGGNALKMEGEYSDGWYIEPTVIEGLGPDCRTNQEEIFGPVVTIAPFKSEDEALESANSTQYGLATTIWTTDLKRAHRLAAQVDAGIVWINTWLLRDLRTPFGGMKNSGMGREGGWEALRFFTEAKNVCVKL